MKPPIRIAIAGVGNCASALLQGLSYYRQSRGGRNGHRVAGLLHPLVGGYAPSDIRVVAAFDVDARKVGKPLEIACLAEPNCTTQFLRGFPRFGVRVQMGPILDGVAPHMAQSPSAERFLVRRSNRSTW